MAQSNIFVERDESLTHLWLFIIINTTVLALLINILSLHTGSNDVAPHLLYIPVVIAAYWYPNRGPVFAVIISALYLFLVWFFITGGLAELLASSIKCYVLIGVSVVVSSLATHMRKNEIRYRGLFNSSEAGVSLVNLPDLSMQESNQHFANILGYDLQELVKIPFSSLWVNPERKENFFRLLTTNDSIENFETRFHTKDAKDRCVLISAGRLPDNQIVCTVVDITDRKHAEELLLIKDHAISSSIAAIGILDLDFTISYVNGSLARTMECPNDKEMIGQNLSRFTQSRTSFDEIAAALNESGSWLGEIQLLKFTGTPFYVLFWADLVKNEAGRTVCVMISFIDITEKKQMEVVKREALEQIEQNIEQFAILGDHIRNPLAVIVGLSSLAPGDITDKIILQAREIDRIITRLDMGWIESEKVRDFVRKYYMTGPSEGVKDKKTVLNRKNRYQ